MSAAQVPAVPISNLFRIATGARESTDFAIGRALASFLSHPNDAVRCDRPSACGPLGLNAIAQTSDGPVRNVRAIVSRQVSSGLVQADIFVEAYNGVGPFKDIGPQTQLRAIAALYPEVLQLVVRDGVDISSVRDLQGKSVSVGTDGSGTYEFVRRLFQRLSLSMKGINMVNTDLYDAADKLTAGEIDAILFVGGSSDGIISRLIGGHYAGLVPPLSEEDLHTAIAGYPTWKTGAIALADYGITAASGETGGVPEIPTIEVMSIWVVRGTASVNRVYALTRALWDPENLDILKAADPEGRNIKLETALPPANIPLHPGAEKYYREIGILASPASASDAPAHADDPDRRPIR